MAPARLIWPAIMSRGPERESTGGDLAGGLAPFRREVYFSAMDRDQVIATLRQHRTALEQRGVLHAALFGSLARGEAGPDSDIDILIDIDPETSKTLSVFGLVGLQRYIGGFFDRRVDLVERDGLKPHYARSILEDACYAF
jgi:predicted nucleotidyltransferase